MHAREARLVQPYLSQAPGTSPRFDASAHFLQTASLNTLARKEVAKLLAAGKEESARVKVRG